MAALNSEHSHTVCVTGGSGYCASHLIARLLERGYKVRASVRDPGDAARTSFLRHLPGAAERLEIVKADLLNPQGLDALVSGCDGVFNVASPKLVKTDDAERDIVQPIVEATMNLLKACAKSSSVERVINTSTVATLCFGLEGLAPDAVIDESKWSSVDALREEKPPIWPYAVGKTLGDQQAYEFASQNDIRLASVLPSLVLGAFSAPQPPNSVALAMGFLKGYAHGNPFRGFTPFVHVDDLAMAHIFLYEDPVAEGRYICNAGEAELQDIARMLSKRHPDLNPAPPSVYAPLALPILSRNF